MSETICSYFTPLRVSWEMSGLLVTGCHWQCKRRGHSPVNFWHNRRKLVALKAFQKRRSCMHTCIYMNEYYCVSDGIAWGFIESWTWSACNHKSGSCVILVRHLLATLDLHGHIQSSVNLKRPSVTPLEGKMIDHKTTTLTSMTPNLPL